MEILFWIIVFLVILFLSVSIVQPNTVKIVLFLWKVSRVQREWLNFIIPFLETTVSQSLAVINFKIFVDTITLDNVKTQVWLNVMFKVKSDDKAITDSKFINSDPITSIKSMVDEQVRAKVFEFNHEEVFWKRTEIWEEIKDTLKSKLSEFWMILDSVQVTDINLDPIVMDSMNRIVAAVKQKTALITEAEWKKQAEILNAEADKEVKKLLWQWMALQRLEISNWFKASIEEIRSADETLDWKVILKFLIDSARLEVLEKVWKGNSKIVYLNENLEAKDSSLVWVWIEWLK